MAAEREKPKEGGEWPNNGDGHERSRLWAAGEAERHEAAGDHAEAEKYRRLAAQHRRWRNDAYAQHMRRQVNRRISYRRW